MTPSPLRKSTTNSDVLFSVAGNLMVLFFWFVAFTNETGTRDA